MGVSDRVAMGVGRVCGDVGHEQVVGQPPQSPTVGQGDGRHGDVGHGEHTGDGCQGRLGAGCRQHDILSTTK